MDKPVELVGGSKLQDALNQAVLGAAMADEAGSVTDRAVSKTKTDKRKSNLPPGPGPGRPKGIPNRVTRTIREAVEMAARDCHPEGLAGWLIERAQGSIQDRQIFAQMVNKAMPLQVQANVGGGIKLELSWLGGRSIGNTAAQLPEPRTQVLDLEQDSDGGYRIKDPNAPAAGAGGGGPAGQEGAGGDERQGS